MLISRSFAPKRFFRRLAVFQLVLVFLSLLLGSFITRYYFKDTFIKETQSRIEQSLKEIQELSQLTKLSEKKVCEFITKHESSARYSLIDKSGNVVCDNYASPEKMDNHLNRKELQGAKKKILGFSIRKSETLEYEMIYGALLIDLQSQSYYLRKSLPLKELNKTIEIIDRSIVLIIFPIFIVLTIFLISRSHSFTEPLRNILLRLNQLGEMNFPNQGKAISKTFEVGEDIDNFDVAFDQVENYLKDYIKSLNLEVEKNSVLVRSISDGIMAVDKDGKILFINENFKNNFLPTYVDSEESINDTIAWDLIRNIQIENAFNKILKGDDSDIQESVTSIETLKRNNEKGFYELIVSPLKGVDGEKLGAMGVFRDESGKKLTDQMRTDFVTNVSHEVRTPLTAMKGFIQIISANTDDLKPEISNYLQRIEQNCDRLIRLFNDVLNLSVINSKAIIERDEIIPKELISNAITNVRQSYREKNIQVESDVSAEVFYGESLMIDQVVTNLIDNAFKYNVQDGKIRVLWKEVGGNAILTIEDSGIGIKEKHYPRLFERFYRIDPSRSREMGGTGLGLAIVKHIVMKHSGKIEIEKSSLGGSLFRVTLPIISKKDKVKIQKK